MPAETTPMRALTMSRPPSVSTSMVSRNVQLPVSPATVPGSRACRSAWNSSYPKPSSPSRRPSSAVTTAKRSTSAEVAITSHPMSAGVPRVMVVSKKYRNRAPQEGRVAVVPGRMGGIVPHGAALRAGTGYSACGPGQFLSGCGTGRPGCSPPRASR